MSKPSLATTPGPTAPPGTTPVTSQTIATVERAADVLVLFARSQEASLGVTEIAQALSLSKAAVHRILASLRTRMLVEVDEDSRRYRLGPTAFALGVAYQSRIDVRQSAAGELAALSHETQETATLSVLSGDSRMYVDQVTPHREIVMSVPLGLMFPLHAGASSKAMLAFLPENELEQALAAPLLALTGSTFTDVGDLRAELARVREQGYATSQGERQAGAASVAAPVFDHEGRPIAAISICGPAERFGQHLQEAVTILPAATARVSSRLGHSSTTKTLTQDLVGRR